MSVHPRPAVSIPRRSVGVTLALHLCGLTLVVDLDMGLLHFVCAIAPIHGAMTALGLSSQPPWESRVEQRLNRFSDFRGPGGAFCTRSSVGFAIGSGCVGFRLCLCGRGRGPGPAPPPRSAPPFVGRRPPPWRNGRFGQPAAAAARRRAPNGGRRCTPAAVHLALAKLAPLGCAHGCP